MQKDMQAVEPCQASRLNKTFLNKQQKHKQRSVINKLLQRQLQVFFL